MAVLVLMAVPVLALMPVMPASATETSQPLASAPARERDRDYAHDRRYSHHGGAGQRQSVYPEVLIEPETEHWQGNYRPDGYRLDGYDGKARSAVICSGTSGRTISTSGKACPPGQTPETRGRSWSTSP